MHKRYSGHQEDRETAAHKAILERLFNVQNSAMRVVVTLACSTFAVQNERHYEIIIFEYSKGECHEKGD
jgi:hypothetical protein